MKLFCEAIAKDVLPAVRSFIAEELMNEYKLNQTEISKILGISQPAVSQYLRRIRGSRKDNLNNEEIRQELKNLCRKMYESRSDDAFEKEFCGVCNLVAEKLKLAHPSRQCVFDGKEAAAAV